MATGNATNIPRFTGWTAPYYSFNREERNLVAILYHLLMDPENTRRFLALLECPWPADDRIQAYLEFAWLRDMWFGWTGTAEERRDLILSFLPLKNTAMLGTLSIYDFNAYFGATPRPSRLEIQSPGKWSMERFAPHIVDNEDFLATCRFKWAFNIKPDLVLLLPLNRAICVEAKLESTEGRYPGRDSERREFQRRGIPLVRQTDLQKYLLEDLLGHDAMFVFLVRGGLTSETHRSLTWRELLTKLDTSASPVFVRHWLARVGH